MATLAVTAATALSKQTQSLGSRSCVCSSDTIFLNRQFIPVLNAENHETKLSVEKVMKPVRVSAHTAHKPTQ